MTEPTDKIDPALSESAPKPASKKGTAAIIEQGMLSAEQHIETWFRDLLASLPQLRETATYNRLRRAIDDLKKRLS